MIEKKTVSLYLNNMKKALKMKMFQENYNKSYLILAYDAIQCVENFESMIQKDPEKDVTLPQKEGAANIIKSIEMLNKRVYELEDQLCSLNEKTLDNAIRARDASLGLCDYISVNDCVCGYHSPKITLQKGIDNERMRAITDTERLDFRNRNKNEVEG